MSTQLTQGPICDVTYEICWKAIRGQTIQCVNKPTRVTSQWCQSVGVWSPRKHPGAAHTTYSKGSATMHVATLLQKNRWWRWRCYGWCCGYSRGTPGGVDRRLGIPVMPKKTHCVVPTMTICLVVRLMCRAIHITATACLGPSLRAKTISNRTVVANSPEACTDRGRASIVCALCRPTIGNDAEHRESVHAQDAHAEIIKRSPCVAAGRERITILS
jgi:hypothetical protein